MMPPNTVSLFSGIGALDFGLEQAGFAICVQAENDDWARQTLRANHDAFPSRVSLFGDVTKLTADRIQFDVTLLTGGPPCQSYSSAGTRRGWNDERGGLVGDYLRLLETVRPRAFLFENVAGFADAKLSDDEPVLHWFLRQAMRAGYAVSWGIMDAVDYGAPQHRERFIILGSQLEYAPAFPNPTHGPRGAVPRRTLRDALQDLSDDLGVVSFSTAKKAIMQHVPSGGNWRDLPDNVMFGAMGELANEWSGKTGYWRRLSWDKPSPTVMSRPDHRATVLCHPDELRPLSVRECARLQCLPDTWDIQGPLYRRYKQVGDAVPVSLGVALGRALKAHLAGSKLARLDGLPVNLMTRTGRNRRIGLWGWSSAGRLRVMYEPTRTLRIA